MYSLQIFSKSEVRFRTDRSALAKMAARYEGVAQRNLKMQFSGLFPAESEEFWMINRDSFVASPEIQQLVTILTTKEEILENKRAAVRESVVYPVTVQFQYELSRHRAFSRDISTGGICLIGEREVEVEQIATLAIYRIDDIVSKIRARCVWSKPFGDQHYMTGWKFLRRILQDDN